MNVVNNEEGSVDLNTLPFVKDLMLQIRAHDSFGSWERKSDLDLIEPFILDTEKLKTIPIIGDPDPEVIWRVEVYYSTIAIVIERKTGFIITPMMKIHHEGFGRVVLLAGRLVVLNRNLRDVHRFGFRTLAKLEAEADKFVNEAVAMIEQFREVASWG